ncbi:MAG: hypothetical protein AB2A00_25895 [Myxococcota bacterium]
MRTTWMVPTMVALLTGCPTGCPVPGFTGITKECGAPQAGAVPRPDGGDVQCTRINELRRQCEEQFTQSGAADIIFVIDNSGSMDMELKGIKENINRFAQDIGNSGLDFHIVMLTKKGTDAYSICVPEPLAGPSCGDHPGKFHHEDVQVESTDGPDLLLGNFPNFAFTWIRPDAKHNVIFVTDDNSALRASDFLRQASALSGLDDATYHGIIGLNANDCPDIASVGQEYIALANQTGGQLIHICCNDYGQLLSDIALGIASAALSFPLALQAVESSIHVFVEDASGRTEWFRPSWRYDATNNSITFDASSQPATGAIITVEYVTD